MPPAACSQAVVFDYHLLRLSYLLCASRLRLTVGGDRSTTFEASSHFDLAIPIMAAFAGLALPVALIGNYLCALDLDGPCVEVDMRMRTYLELAGQMQQEREAEKEDVQQTKQPRQQPLGQFRTTSRKLRAPRPAARAQPVLPQGDAATSCLVALIAAACCCPVGRRARAKVRQIPLAAAPCLHPGCNYEAYADEWFNGYCCGQCKNSCERGEAIATSHGSWCELVQLPIDASIGTGQDLIVFLHGIGGTPASMGPYIATVLTAIRPVNARIVAPTRGPRWWTYDKNGKGNPRGIVDSRNFLLDLLPKLQRTTGRVIIVGYSQGASLALDVGLRSSLVTAVFADRGLLEETSQTIGTTCLRVMAVNGAWDNAVALEEAMSSYEAWPGRVERCNLNALHLQQWQGLDFLACECDGLGHCDRSADVDSALVLFARGVLNHI